MWANQFTVKRLITRWNSLLTITIFNSSPPSIKKQTWSCPGSNRGPSACEADVMNTKLQDLFDKWILTLKFQNTIISWKWSPLKLAKSVCSNTTDHQLGHAKAINGLEAAKVIRQMEGKEVHFQSKLFTYHRNNWCINHAIFHLFKSSTCSIGVNNIFQK